MIRSTILFLLFQQATANCSWELVQDVTELADVSNTTTDTRVRVALSQSGNYLGVWSDQDRKIRILDRSNNVWTRQFSDTLDSWTGSMVLASDGTIVTDGDSGTVVSPYDRTGDHEYAQFIPIEKQKHASFSISTSGNVLAVGSDLYDMSNKTGFPRRASLLTPNVTKSRVSRLSGHGKKFFSLVNDDRSTPAVVKVYRYREEGASGVWKSHGQLMAPSYLADVSRIYISNNGALVVLQSSDNHIALFRHEKYTTNWRLESLPLASEGVAATQVQLAAPEFHMLIQTVSGRPGLYQKRGSAWSYQEETGIGLSQDLAMSASGKTVAVASKGDNLSIRLYNLECAAPNFPPPVPSLAPVPTTVPALLPSRPPSRSTKVSATVFDLEWSIAFRDHDQRQLDDVHLRRWQSATEYRMEEFYQQQNTGLVVQDFRTALRVERQWNNEQGDLILRYHQQVNYTIFGSESMEYPPSYYVLLPLTEPLQREAFPKHWQSAIPDFESIVIPLVMEPYLTNRSRTEYHTQQEHPIRENSIERKTRSAAFIVVVSVLLALVSILTIAVVAWYFYDKRATRASKKQHIHTNASVGSVIASPMEFPPSRELPLFKDQVTTLPLASAVLVQEESSDSIFANPPKTDYSADNVRSSTSPAQYGMGQSQKRFVSTLDVDDKQPAFKRSSYMRKPPMSPRTKEEVIVEEEEPVVRRHLPLALRRTLWSGAST